MPTIPKVEPRTWLLSGLALVGGLIFGALVFAGLDSGGVTGTGGLGQAVVFLALLLMSGIWVM